MNRETWLHQATEEMRAWFDQAGFPLPEIIMLGCGWPKHRGGKSKAVGECFDAFWTKDGTTQIFICPTLERGVRVLDVLLHQLCHAAVGTTVGHHGPFVKLIRLFGLEGKATHTVCREGSALYNRLAELEAKIGPYPHSSIRDQKMAATRPPGGGWLKCQSRSLGSGYILRISPKSLAEFGLPKDPNGDEMALCK